MRTWAKVRQIELDKLPPWCRGEESDEEAVDDTNEGGEEKDEDNSLLDEMVGKFIYKDFGGTVYGGTIVATDTCASSKRKMYVYGSL